MSAQIKLLRLLGAALVTLALVPWLGSSPAAATGGGNDKSPSHAKGNDRDNRDDEADKSAKSDQGKGKDKNNADRDDKSTKNRGHNDDDDDRGHDDDDDDDGHAQTAPPSTTKSHGGGSGHHQKVTLCHRTNSESNPYVRITVSVNSVVKVHGHDGHDGPIFAAGMKSAKQKWGDIIPSFTYTTKGGSSATYGGKNWPSGQAVFNAGCKVPTQPTGSSTPTVTPTVTPTSPGPSSTTTVTQTVTTSPDTSVAPTKIGNTDDSDDDDTVVLGNKSGPLARTGLGLSLGAALGLSLALLLAGGTLMVAPARMAMERRRRH